MNATTFDSLAAARKLRAAGFEQGPAEALAESLHEIATANRQDFATKVNLKAAINMMKADLKAQIKAGEARLAAEIVATANRSLIATLVALGVMLAVLRLL